VGHNYFILFLLGTRVMKASNPITVALYTGSIATVVGAIIFFLSWHFWEYFEGPIPGYQFFMFPGNLTLIHFWHPLFTEEVNFWPKLAMLLLGQFVVVSNVTAIFIYFANRLKAK